MSEGGGFPGGLPGDPNIPLGGGAEGAIGGGSLFGIGGGTGGGQELGTAVGGQVRAILKAEGITEAARVAALDALLNRPIRKFSDRRFSNIVGVELDRLGVDRDLFRRGSDVGESQAVRANLVEAIRLAVFPELAPPDPSTFPSSPPRTDEGGFRFPDVGAGLEALGDVLGRLNLGGLTQSTLQILCNLGILPFDFCRPADPGGFGFPPIPGRGGVPGGIPLPGGRGVPGAPAPTPEGGAMPLIGGEGLSFGGLSGLVGAVGGLVTSLRGPGGGGSGAVAGLGPTGAALVMPSMGGMVDTLQGQAACISPRLSTSMRLPRIVDVPLTDAGGNLKCHRYVKAPMPRYRVTMTNPSRGRRGRR